MVTTPEPVWCTLGQRDARSQALEWVDLQQHALDASPLATGVRMSFPVEHASSIEDLAEREATCCAFLDIGTSRDGDVFVLEITSENPEALGVIAALSGVPLS